MSNTSNQTKLEQGRAAFAFECADSAKEKLGDKKKEYKSHTKALPMLIKTNGLGAALAFAFAKGSTNGQADEKKEWGLIYHQVEAWLKRDGKQLIDLEEKKLVEQLTEIDSATYRATTIEVLAFLSWLSRFADGLIDTKS
jgi:CRISPR-associated protein Cmr5